MSSGPPLLVTAAPHVKSADSTPRIMWTVVLTLLPVLGVGVYHFGPGALLVVAAAVAGAVLPEHFLGRRRALGDGSAAITGLLLGLTLPPGFPLWMAFLGGAFGISFGKLVFGGLGQNVFNPALVGRAFLQAAFPVAITTWPAPAAEWATLRGDVLATPLMSAAADTVTAATPLGLMKFESTGTAVMDLFLGSTGGCIGETSALLILVCGVFLAAKRYLDWRIPLSMILTTAVISGVLHAIDADYPGALFMVFSGGLVLGAVYMATDMVTSPVTAKGAWIFGAGIGVLVVVIRVWGGLAEGVMYAILLMNSLVPFINRATQPRVFGQRPRPKPQPKPQPQQETTS